MVTRPTMLVLGILILINKKVQFDFGVCSGFRMNVREMHTNATERQLTEAIKIENMTGPSMNRKSGNGGTRPLGRRNYCVIQ